MEEILRQLFSHNRMSSYTDHEEYIRNISYSMNLYPRFHFFEIALRNKIDDFIKEYLKQERFGAIHKLNTKLTDGSSITSVDIGGFVKAITKHNIFSNFSHYFTDINVTNCKTYQSKINQMLHNAEIIEALKANWLLELYNENSCLIFNNRTLSDIIDTVKRINKPNITHEDILSNLNLGFWVNMFSSKFISDNKISNSQYCKSIFNKDSIDIIRKDLNYMKFCRNRVFHFEKILRTGKVSNEKLENLLNTYLKDLDKSKNLFNILPKFKIEKI